MKSYQSYNPSGIEWISEKPENWSSTKLKYVSNIITGNTPSKNNEDNYIDGKFLWIKPDGLNEFEPTNDCKEKISEIGLTETRIVPPYSVLINGIGNIGKFGYSELPVSTNQQIHSIVFNPKKVDKRYGLFLISSLKDEMNRNSEKVVVSIYTKSKLERLEFILPPIQEQEQIVNYLDEKTTIIDKLISTKKRKVELLKEQRTTIINQVITKGLNPNVKLKHSGVEWIGEIPENWRICKLKLITSLITDGSHFSPIIENEGKYYISVSDITKSNGINFEDCKKISQSSFDELEKNGCRPKTRDILITKDGTIGRGCIVGDFNDFVILSSLGLIRLNENQNEKYILYYLLSQLNVSQMYSHIRGSGITRLTIKLIKDLLIVVPSFEEQHKIVDYLNKQTKEIDDLVFMEESKIELLKEYRQSLISEVITGKIKVV